MLQMTFRHVPTSDALQTHAEEQLSKLRQRFPSATACHVVVEGSKQPHDGRFHVHLELSVSNHHPRISARAAHEDAFCATREVFDKALRQAHKIHVANAS